MPGKFAKNMETSFPFLHKGDDIAINRRFKAVTGAPMYGSDELKVLRHGWFQYDSEERSGSQITSFPMERKSRASRISSIFFQGQRVRGTKPRDRECKTYHRRTPNLTSFIPGIRLRE